MSSSTTAPTNDGNDNIWETFVQSVNVFQWVYGGSLVFLLIILAVYVPYKEFKKQKLRAQARDRSANHEHNPELENKSRRKFHLKNEAAIKQHV